MLLRIGIVVGIGVLGGCKNPAPAQDKAAPVASGDAAITVAVDATSADAALVVDAALGTDASKRVTTWTVHKAGEKCFSKLDYVECPPAPPGGHMQCEPPLGEVKCPDGLPEN